MSDNFWMYLFGLLTLVAKDLLDQWRANRLRAGQKIVEDKVDVGNVMTGNVIPAVTEKVDSVTHEAKAASDATKDAAKIAAVESAKNQEKIVSSVKELAQTIKGDDGTCVTARLKKLEEGHGVLAERIGKVEAAVGEGLTILREMKATGT